MDIVKSPCYHDEALQENTISYLRDGSAIEGVCLYDVGAGIQEGIVNCCDDIRPRHDQQVIVSLQLRCVGLVPGMGVVSNRLKATDRRILANTL